MSMDDMIRVTVRPFGPATDILGSDPIEYGLAPPAKLGTLVALMHAKYPRLSEGSRSLRYAVNEEYAGDLDIELHDGDEVAIIPPVAGGGGVALTREPIDLAAMVKDLEHASCGAMVTFTGEVRAERGAEGPLVALDYSAHESMALKKLERLRTAALERFAIRDASVVHRLGRLAIGEPSVVIVVAAAHRADAFEACRWIIDTLKEDVPIWKRELWQEGEPTWAEPEPS